jgi:hypothetical protein
MTVDQPTKINPISTNEDQLDGRSTHEDLPTGTTEDQPTQINPRSPQEGQEIASQKSPDPTWKSTGLGGSEV